MPVTIRDLYPDDKFTLSHEVKQAFAVATEIFSDRQNQLAMKKNRVQVCLRLLRMASLDIQIKALKPYKHIVQVIMEWHEACREVEKRIPEGTDFEQAMHVHMDLMMWVEVQTTVAEAMYPMLDRLPRRMVREPDYIVDWKLIMPIEAHTNFRDLANGMFQRFHFMFYYCQTRSIKTMEAILRHARNLLQNDHGPFEGDALALKTIVEHSELLPSAEVAVFVRVMEYVEVPWRRLAFAMATHPRLGAYSPAAELETEFVEAIARRAG
jgi:hypothetical protein